MKNAGQRVYAGVPRLLRRKYQEIWGYAWPFESHYLAQLYLDAKAAFRLPPESKARRLEVRKLTLDFMRECHDFGEHPAPFGNLPA